MAAIGFELTVSHAFIAFGGSLVIATPSYIIWQVVALVVRQFLTWHTEQGSRRRDAPPRSAL